MGMRATTGLPALVLVVIVAITLGCSRDRAAEASTPADAKGDAPRHLVNATSDAPPTWGLMAIPKPAGAARALLSRVACASEDRCVAVGYDATLNGAEQLLVEVRVGPTWTVEPVRTPAAAGSLTGVACPSASGCAVVGSSTSRSDVQAALAESWNGSQLVRRGLPLARIWTSSELTQVSCTSTSSCTAVGSSTNRDGIQQTLVERWNGSSWRREGAPNVPGALASTLHAVSCSSSTFCSAVGYAVSATGGTAALAEAWDGHVWRIVSLGVPRGRTSRPWSELSGVSCTSSRFCMAVGDYGVSTAKPFVGFAERWDGTDWTLELPPSPGGATKSPLIGISCPEPTACVAVGFWTGPTREATLIERWSSGAWRRQASPNRPAAVRLNDLSGVSCRTTVACTAVGYAGSGGLDAPLAARSPAG
jgi:hypothetical protein